MLLIVGVLHNYAVCHPELVSGSRRSIITEILKRVQDDILLKQRLCDTTIECFLSERLVMKSQELELILDDLNALKSPKKAQDLQWFFKTGPGEYGEGDLFLGIVVPELRKLSRKYIALGLQDLKALLHSKWHEKRMVALFIIRNQFERGLPQRQKELYEFYCDNLKFVNNWDLVDCSALYIAGAYLWDKNEQQRKVLYDWAVSGHLWTRRISIMSTFYDINRGWFTDSLKLSKLLLQDKHDLIHKAVGWMLREIGKRELEVELRFLDDHYNVMPRTMLRYAIEKFPEELRQDYLKGRRVVNS